MDEFFTLPKIDNLEDITIEQARQYIRYVATMRHNQRRYFATKNYDALSLSKRMEKDLDALNEHLLNPIPTLFG